MLVLGFLAVPTFIVVAFLVFAASGVEEGDISRPPAPALKRPTNEVTCAEMDPDTSRALSAKVVRDLELPDRVDKYDAETRTEDAISDACVEADGNEHPVDSDFKRSLRAKLDRGER